MIKPLTPNPSPSGRGGNSLKQWRRLVGWALALVILFFLIRTLWSSWDQVAASGFQFQFNWLPLGISLALLVIGRGFAVEAWRRILLTLGNTVTFRFAFYAWFISNLARFIPGNVWQLAAMMFLTERQGVSKMNVLLSRRCMRQSHCRLPRCMA